MRNSAKATGDPVSGTAIAVVLSIMLLRLLFHSGSGIIQEVQQKGPYFFAYMSDGHVYEASRCISEIGQTGGNYVRFTAIGPDITLFGEHIAAAVIVRCEFTGVGADNFEPLP